VTPRLVPAGDRALVVEFEATISADVNCKVRALELLLLRAGLDGIVETVPSFRSLLVYYDPLRVAYRELCDVLAQMAGQASADVLPAPRRIELPCCYDDPELGFELRAAAEKLALSTDELIRIHSGDEYLVYFLGFAPGQPYMTGRAGRLAIPRLPTPRTRTPAGSVGIGGAQCCIYSVESPGGFWVLGRTPVRLFDPGAAEPILLQAGDIVHFRRIVRAEYAEVEDAVARRVYQPEIG
jgi:inhibitor of KinA